MGGVKGSGFTTNERGLDLHEVREGRRLGGEAAASAVASDFQVQSHRDYRDWADPKLGEGEARVVDEGRVASAYSREQSRQWGWGEDGRKVRHFTAKADGSVDWRSGREVKSLDQQHPTVRRMGEVLLAEPFPLIKNHGARLHSLDSDWKATEQ